MNGGSGFDAFRGLFAGWMIGHAGMAFVAGLIVLTVLMTLDTVWPGAIGRMVSLVAG